MNSCAQISKIGRITRRNRSTTIIYKHVSETNELSNIFLQSIEDLNSQDKHKCNTYENWPLLDTQSPYQRITIIPISFSDHYAIKLEVKQ